MCGIFGVIITKDAHILTEKKVSIAHALFRASESRGKEASGLITVHPDKISYLKAPSAPTNLLKDGGATLLANAAVLHEHFICVGHTRLATNGDLHDNHNNQPICVGGTLGVHNGIVVNDTALWQQHPHLQRKTALDTESIVALIDIYRKEHGVGEALQNVYREAKGTMSTALVCDDIRSLILTTNNGSLYTYYSKADGIFIFASEYRILKAVLVKELDKKAEPTPLLSLHGLIVSFDLEHHDVFQLHGTKPLPIVHIHDALPIVDTSTYHRKAPVQSSPHIARAHFERLFQKADEEIQQLRRCTRCILPETFPYIHYDAQGVCNYCAFYQPLSQAKDRRSLLQQLQRDHNKKKVSVHTTGDLILGFSGGRDSCYGLHMLVKEYGLKPIAYTYDWGVITDLGRRNQARLCAQLGIEHILVSADIQKKRAYIHKNITAWLRRPNLGMVPLFTAGDKQYFQHLNTLAHDLQISSIVLCENPLERTHFKQGFCDITHHDNTVPPYQSSMSDKLKIATFYAQQFLRNPQYINTSLFDTFSAYLSYYFIPHDYVYLFDYLSWDEETVNDVLLNEYDWELAPDTTTTWRIGDGTAPFYNYIYYLLAGFTENDTLRSNQIREGTLTREAALEKAHAENQPRWESLTWYLNTMSIDITGALTTIHAETPIWKQPHHVHP
jgi:glutamine---fructose-6-phosphate transaminase (isomerizing)